MADPCNYCHDARLVGWSGAGPILCPECSRGQDAFTVITQAWREQRARVRELEDCGQNGVCALSPGCIRHWQERNRELVTERDQQTLRANRCEADVVMLIRELQACRERELEAELAKLREGVRPTRRERRVMAECEVSRDRVWNDQYHCSGHSVWFRDTIHPCLCPAGEAEARLESALAELAKLREERRWVPVEERLPKKQDHYLCGTREHDDVVLSWDGIAWDHPDDSLADWEYWNAQVLRWMHLPAPPGEKGE